MSVLKTQSGPLQECKCPEWSHLTSPTFLAVLFIYLFFIFETRVLRVALTSLGKLSQADLKLTELCLLLPWD